MVRPKGGHHTVAFPLNTPLLTADIPQQPWWFLKKPVQWVS